MKFFLLLVVVAAASASSWMDVACSKNPSLPLCQDSTNSFKNPDKTPVVTEPQFTTVRGGRESTEDFLTKLACGRQPDLALCNEPDIAVGAIDGTVIPITVSLVDSSQPGQVPPVRDAYCTKYSNHYLHYCNNVTSHDMELQKKLFKYCPIYMINCPKPTPVEEVEVEDTQAPCVRGCREPHCTRDCICAHYVPQIKRECRPGAGAHIFTTSCTLWYRSCAHLYDLPHEWFNYGISDKVPLGAQLVEGRL